MIPPLLLPRTTGRAVHHCTANKSFDSLPDFVRSCLAAQWRSAVRFGSKHHVAFDRLGVSGVEGPTEDPVGGGAEGDWEVEEPVEDPAPGRY